MTRIVCPRCGKYGTFMPWKDGHNGTGNLIYHPKRGTEPNRCYIDPITSINIKASMGMEEQKQGKLMF